MRISSLMGLVEGPRKLRGLAAVVEDPSATEYEKANAQDATARLQHRLKRGGVARWRLNGQRLSVRPMGRRERKSTSSTSPKGDDAQRIGKVLLRGMTGGCRISELPAWSALVTHRRARAADRFG
jgi:hypothetical protein